MGFCQCGFVLVRAFVAWDFVVIGILLCGFLSPIHQSVSDLQCTIELQIIVKVKMIYEWFIYSKLATPILLTSEPSWKFIEPSLMHRIWWSGHLHISKLLDVNRDSSMSINVQYLYETCYENYVPVQGSKMIINLREEVESNI